VTILDRELSCFGLAGRLACGDLRHGTEYYLGRHRTVVVEYGVVSRVSKITDGCAMMRRLAELPCRRYRSSAVAVRLEILICCRLVYQDSSPSFTKHRRPTIMSSNTRGTPEAQSSIVPEHGIIYIHANVKQLIPIVTVRHGTSFFVHASSPIHAYA
jgi:hypothetical protein